MSEIPTHKMVLNDDTVVQVNWCTLSGTDLVMSVAEKTMQECIAIFCDPTKTAKIVYHYGDNADVFYNYTVPVVFNYNSANNITVILV